jgi:hypothetical protein
MLNPGVSRKDANEGYEQEECLDANGDSEWPKCKGADYTRDPAEGEWSFCE